MVVAGGLIAQAAPGKPAPAPAPAPTPPAAARASWADWVGEYRGALTWRSCSAPGPAGAVLALDATDAVMSIELGALEGGLRAMSLVEEDGGWIGSQGGVEVRITRPRPAAPGAIEILVALDSGCTARGRLQRAQTGVPACDRLVGWTRALARCGKLAQRGGAPLEDAVAVGKLRFRPADAEACSTRAARVERSMIDAGCAPHPDPAIGHRAPDCLRLADAAARVARCKRLPPELEAALVSQAQGLRAASETAERATLGVVERQCRDAAALLAAAAAQFQCPP